MKIKLVLLGLILGIAFLGGCNDTLTEVGINTKPSTDGVEARADTFYMTAKTLMSDSVYARTTTGALGELVDPMFGTLKSDYLCQFYCPDNFSFNHTPIDGKIDSVVFKIFYNSWTGDSLTPMRVQLYQVTTPLQKDYYTNVDPKQFCDMKIPLGSKTYTAHDMTVSDSIRNSSYSPNIAIHMPTAFGQRFYNETINNRASFANQDAFNKFFPGLYVTTTFGSGNVINVASSEMYIFYKYTTTGSAGQDSIVKTYENFNVTSEVIQLNRFKNSNISHLLQPNDSVTYLRSPAGVYTEFTIPSKAIASAIDGRILSNMNLTLKAYPQDDWDFAFEPPSEILILPSDSVDKFFKSHEIENSSTAFRASYSSSTRSYDFNNICNILKDHIEKAPDKDLRISVIPVERKVGSTSSYYYGTSTYTTAINNYLQPSGVKLRINNETMRLRIVTIKYK
jgi:hypothetical protein